MIKNLLQLTLLSFIWKRYRNVIISTLVLFVFFWLVGMLHDDYVNYSRLNDDRQYLALSFFIKWLSFLIGVFIYLIYNARFSLRVSSDQASNKALSRKDKKHGTHQTVQADPFEKIRQQDKLRSKADFVIQKNTDKND